MISLYVIQGSDQGRRFELNQPISTIGRNPRCDIHLRDAEISRRHASIRCSGEEYRIVDNDSINGIYVNGCQTKDQVLNNGDQILLGQTLLLFATQPVQEQEINALKPDHFFITIESNEIGPQVYSSSSGETMLHSQMFSGSSEWSPQIDGHLKMMYHTTLVTTQTLDIGILLHRILDLIFEWVHIDRGCILLLGSEDNQLKPMATRLSQKSPDGERTHRPVKFSINRSIVSHVLKTREGILTNDTQADSRWSALEKEVEEVICVPMLGRYGLVGVIYIDTLSPLERERVRAPSESEDRDSSSQTQLPRFTSDHFRLMIAVAHQAALAVEDTRYYKGMIQGERLAAVGRTVTTLSHHIKNILQGISGGSHLIQLGLDRHNEDLIRQGWGIVEKNQSRISRLIHDMLTFSKEREPTYTFGDIRSIVRDAVELMRSRADDMNVTVELEEEEEIPAFFFDSEQIHRAVVNLVTNAIDAAGTYHDVGEMGSSRWKLETLRSINVYRPNQQRFEGQVRIRIEVDQSRRIVMILIEDDGPGIAPELRPVLFRPFYSERRGRGTGLGLPVAWKIVQEHGGTIRIDDSVLGGAKFVIELPLKMVLDDSKIISPNKG